MKSHLKNFLVLSLLIALTFYPGVYDISAQVWTQVGSDMDGEAVDDWSGYSVAISTDGKRVAIGAIQNDGSGFNAGHVRVYEENAGIWTQVGSDINGEAAGDNSGYRVSLSSDGKRLAIGAINNAGGGFHSGHVRVFAESGGSWTQVGNDINGEAADDWFGYSVSLSADGRRVAIGGLQNDGSGIDAGHVRVYKQSGSNWTKVGNDIDGEAAGDHFGRSVSLSADGKRLAVGAGGNDGSGIDAGHVRVFSEIGGTWIQLGNDIDGEAAGDVSGVSLSLSPDGNRVAIGAIWNDGAGTNAGHVRVYAESGGIWTQVGNDIDGEAAEDQSGTYISLSTNGQRVAIGAYRNDGNGTDAGHVRVYSESGGAWSQVANDIDGEAAGDWSGDYVALSGTGQRVAIGAYRNDDNGLTSGHVRVYDEAPCDADMDGYDNAACGGSDCDDNDASVNPGVSESCNGLDDNCNNVVDEGTDDGDGDGVCDDVDNCPTNANADQADADGDNAGDVCDACPNDPENDADNDGICSDSDNCPSHTNSGQEDSDCDTVGDACDVCPDGDDSVDNNSDGIADCSQLLNYTAYSSAWKCGTNKIYVCHSGVTQCISKNQLSTHYNHGDNIGPCISCGEQNLNIPEGIGDFAQMQDYQELEIFPNPAKDFLNISFDEEIQSLEIISPNGFVRKISEYETGRPIDISSYPSGIYFMMIQSGDQWYQAKFSKL